MGTAANRRKNIWLTEINDLIRGMCGGFLFGIPLLYTMEIWWIGSESKPGVLLLAIGVVFFVVFWLNRTEGFRRSRTRSHDALMDTVEAIAIGLLCSSVVLVLLRELTLDTPLREALGKIIFEAVPFTLGVALANQFLGDSRDAEAGSPVAPEVNATLSDVGATLIGAIVIAFNIAPTDEIPMLAAAITPPWLLGIMAASLLISYGIVFEAGFSDQQKRRQQQGIFQRPSSETIAAYLVSLLAAALMLWFFQRLNFSDPWTIWLEQTLILGLPATIGGAAGRLAV